MNALEEAGKDITGLAALRDWLGDGGVPVHPMVAEIRATRCTEGNNGQPCPQNKIPGWWNLRANFKKKVAKWIRAELELKEQKNLRVTSEPKLHMCAACGCCLPLKVWVPGPVVREHTPAKVLSATPDYCWIRKEFQ